MLPWIILAVAAVLLLVMGFGVMRSRSAAEHPVAETDADRARNEQEYAEAERYQEQWREEHRKELDDDLIP